MLSKLIQWVLIIVGLALVGGGAWYHWGVALAIGVVITLLAASLVDKT
jgi:hypothetical protein